MGAYASRRQIAAEPAQEAAPKRLRTTPSAFAAVIEKEENVTKILEHTGFQAVLALETLNWRVRRAVRGARLEFGVASQASNREIWTAIKVSQRAEILEARRLGLWREDTLETSMRTIEPGSSSVRRGRSDVVFRDERTLCLSPRPKCDGGGGVDAARSAASHAAAERRRSSLLALGCLEITVDASTDASQEARRHKAQASELGQWLFKSKPRGSPVDEREAAALVEAMGGAFSTPRRLVLAASRPAHHNLSSSLASRKSLDAALELSARHSAVLDKASIERLLVEFWIAIDKHKPQSFGLTKAQFYEMAAAANVSSADAAWTEVIAGSLPPFAILYAPADEHHEPRNDGDVRPGDQEWIDVLDWFWPATCALALTTIAGGDPVKCFAADFFMPWASAESSPELSAENLVFDNGLDVRLRRRMASPLKPSENGGHQALWILDALAFPRPGESDPSAGEQRVNAAIASLLVPTRIKPLAVGDLVECCLNGSPHVPQPDLDWDDARVLELNCDGADGVAKIRVDNLHGNDVTLKTAQLRLKIDRTPAAAVLLAVCLGDHRNDIVRQILSSPSMKDPLLYEVMHFQAGGTRVLLHATALDHAITRRNVVGVSLLAAKYSEPGATDGNYAHWHAAIGVCTTLNWTQRHDLQPSERADFMAALLVGPCSYVAGAHVWILWKPELLRYHLTRAAINGNLSTITKEMICGHAASLVYNLARPWHAVSSRFIPLDQRLPWQNIHDNSTRMIVEVLLNIAAKAGNAAVIARVQSLVPKFMVEKISFSSLCLAIAEGHHDCVDVMLRGPWLDRIVTTLAPPGTHPDFMQGFRIVSMAIAVNDVSTLEMLRARGVDFSLSNHPVGGYMAPLESACFAGMADCVRVILEDQGVVDRVLARRSDAICYAAQQGHASCLAALLTVPGVTVEHTNPNSPLFPHTPLQYGVHSGSPQLVGILCEHVTDIDAATPPGAQTPLMMALDRSNVILATLLLARGASLTTRCGAYCAFDCALSPEQGTGSAEAIVRLCQRMRPDECKLSDDDWIAKFRERGLAPAVLAPLLEAGCDSISVQDSASGLTALHYVLLRYACLENPIGLHSPAARILDLLVLHGADLTLKTKRRDGTADVDEATFRLPDGVHVNAVLDFDVSAGLTPMDLARTVGHSAETRAAAVAALEAAIRKAGRS